MAAEPIIDDDLSIDDLAPPGMGRGYVERDYEEFPADMFAPPTELQLIPRSEYSDRIKEQERTRSRVSDMLMIGDAGRPIPAMDQGPNGYCWSHSTVAMFMAMRAIMGLPYVALSAYMVAAIIKRGLNQGGWCGLSAQFISEHGASSQEFWPQGNRNLALDTPEMRANAALHKSTEDWVDVSRAVYDRNLTFDMVATILLTGRPCAGDFNHMAHSVMLCDLVEVERGSFGIRFRNSWGPNWGDGNGFGILRGQKAIPDGALAFRSVTVSPK